MIKLNLVAKNNSEQRILEYLQENVSEVLVEKINNGTPFTKDNKQLINKKTLEGFMKFACDEARKQSEKGANSACIEDSVVFGWAIHYFEEDSIQGTFYTLIARNISRLLKRQQRKQLHQLRQLQKQNKKTAE